MGAFDPDRSQVIERAGARGVELFVTVPSRKGDAAACVALAAGDQRIFATAGLHPHEASAWDEAAEKEIQEALVSPRVVAVGEIGLDFHYDYSPRKAQAEVFRRQISIARGARKPIVVHTRSAAAQTIEILKEEGAREIGGVLHCFTENAAAARTLLDLGFWISFSGIVTFPKATDIQEAARLTPADRILVETDAPYLAPIPHRGKRNEPALLESTISFLAKLRGEDPEDLAVRALENCKKAFGISS
jgi:TatD DNase family protein